jgi:hypothetical protein
VAAFLREGGLFCVRRSKDHPMPFAIRNLSVLAYAQGFTLWHYKGAAVSLHETKSPGFFDGASDMLAAGDMLLVSARDGGRMGFVAQDNGRVMLAPLS